MNDQSKRVIRFFAAAFLLFVSAIAGAANHYIRDGGTASTTGTGACTSWATANACDNFPATMVRGDTYYVADGSYGTKTFNQATSGTTLIYVRKATVADHGTSTGWVDTYGDGQATWVGWTVSSNYWDIDGVVGTGDTLGSYGFYINNDASGATVITLNASNVSFKHIEASASVTTCDTVTNLNVIIYAVNGGSGFLLQDSFLHESNSWAMMGFNNWNGATFNRNYFLNACRKELLSARNDTNIVFSNNIVENVAGTCILGMESPSSFQIYNNVFFTTTPSYDTTDGAICVPLGWGTGNNIVVYGNTFVNLEPETVISFQGGTGNIVRNNLWYGPNGTSYGSGITHTHNWCAGSNCTAITSETSGQGGSGNPFVNLGANDFRLTGATNAGFTLGAPYNTDITGAIRGADGVWDRGAYEYDAGGGVLPAPINLRWSPR